LPLLAWARAAAMEAEPALARGVSGTVAPGAPNRYLSW
jgi:hypothetical protein